MVGCTTITTTYNWSWRGYTSVCRVGRVWDSSDTKGSVIHCQNENLCYNSIRLKDFSVYIQPEFNRRLIYEFSSSSSNHCDWLWAFKTFESLSSWSKTLLILNARYYYWKESLKSISFLLMCPQQLPSCLFFFLSNWITWIDNCVHLPDGVEDGAIGEDTNVDIGYDYVVEMSFTFIREEQIGHPNFARVRKSQVFNLACMHEQLFQVIFT